MQCMQSTLYAFSPAFLAELYAKEGEGALGVRRNSASPAPTIVHGAGSPALSATSGVEDIRGTDIAMFKALRDSLQSCHTV
jgi:hypothetical protein